MNKPKIRIALVGCGRIAKNHIQAIQQLQQDLELVAICDTHAERLDETAQSIPHAVAYGNYDQLLKATDANLITLCTPSGIHAAQTIKAANAGKHVITEKPMATRWQDGLAMLRACDVNNVRLFVVKQNRHNTTLQHLKKAIMQNRFGRIYMVTVNVFWARPQDYYDQAQWRGTWELDGGALMNQASHYIDLLHWLVGPIASVSAMTGTLARNIETEDTGVMMVRWRSGTLGSVNVTVLTFPKNLEGSITIIGEKGTVKIGGIALNKIEHWEFEESQPQDEQIRGSSYDTASVYGFGHTAYYRNVIDALRGEAEPAADGRSGLRSLELLVAAYLSARDNQQVSLPLEH